MAEFLIGLLLGVVVGVIVVWRVVASAKPTLPW